MPIPLLADITTLPSALPSLLPSTQPAAAAAGRTFTADQVLSPYVYVFYASFIVAFLFTPIMRAVAMHYGVVDRPDSSRKIHREPVAYLGGVAVFLGWIFSLAIARFVQLHYFPPGADPHPHINLSIVVGAMVIVFLGLWDDLKGVRPRLKIAAQVIAAGLLLSFGVGDRCARPILGQIQERISIWQTGHVGMQVFPDWVVGAVSACLVIALVVGCCNATNLMDGLDGLCGGVTGIIAAGYVFLSVHLAMSSGAGNINEDGLRIILALALLGAVLGFIPYNFNPASIFMGDTGSMLMGYAIALQIALMAQDGGKWFLGALVIFALPVLDTSLAFVRRYVNGRPVFSADKHHIHHQLMARGMTVRRTVLTLYAMAIGFALLGVSITFVRTRYAGAAYLVIFGSLIVAAYKMGMVHERAVVLTPTTIDTTELAATPAPPIEPAGVLELPDPRPSGNVQLASQHPATPPLTPPPAAARPQPRRETASP